MSDMNTEREKELQQADMKCLFCRIANGKEPKSKVLYEKDGVVIFRDIRPASTHHYLVLPQKHMGSAKSLGSEDLELLEKLVTCGREFLVQQGGSLSEARLGFHWPPFHSIHHLHLHVISPTRGMGWLSSLIFKADSFWFVSETWLLNRLRNMKSKQ